MGRRSAPVAPLGAVLRGIGAIRVPAGVDASPVSTRDWEAAVGSRIAARARPGKLERGVLQVRTATSTWAQELSLLADAIVSQLRGRGIDVVTLRFNVGPVEPPERPPSRQEVRRAPPSAPLPKELADEVAKVADEDLRAAIAEAAGKNLGWQIDATAARPTSKRPGARAPRSAESKTARPDHDPPSPPGARRGRP